MKNYHERLHEDWQALFDKAVMIRDNRNKVLASLCEDTGDVFDRALYETVLESLKPVIRSRVAYFWANEAEYSSFRAQDEKNVDAYGIFQPRCHVWCAISTEKLNAVALLLRRIEPVLENMRMVSAFTGEPDYEAFGL